MAIIDPSRLMTWEGNVGVPGGIAQYLPGGASERTNLLDVTATPYFAAGNVETTTGTIADTTTALVVADATNFAVGNYIHVGFQQVEEFEVTVGASAEGPVNMTIFGTGTSIYVTNGMTPAQVATEIRTINLNGTTFGGTPGSAVVTFAHAFCGAHTLAVISNANGTGVEGNSTVTVTGSHQVNNARITVKVINTLTLDAAADGTAIGARVFHDDASSIQAAVDAAVADDVVYLPAGTYNSSGVEVNKKSYITVRGAGPGIAIVNSLDVGGRFFIHGKESNDPPPAWPAVIAGYTKGSNTITVDDTTGAVAGARIAIGPNVLPTWAHNLGGYPDTLRTLLFQFKIRSVVPGESITFDPPLPFDLTGMTPVFQYYLKDFVNDGFVQGVGFESFTVDLNESTVNGAFGFETTWGCWLYDVEIKNAFSRQMRFDSAVRCEVRHCYTHASRGGGPNHEGIDFAGGDSFNLVEDNICNKGGFPPIIFGDGINGCSGNVVAYNYCLNSQDGASWDISMNHGGHNMLNLTEGNVIIWYKDDGYWGSQSHNTLLRNRISWQIALLHFAVYYNVVGNVIGDEANTVYESSLNGIFERSCYQLGYPNIGNPGYTGTFGPTTPPDYSGLPNTLGGCQERDLNVETTLIRHGNYDSVNAAIIWDGGIPDHVIPDSYYLAGKPDYFGGLTWPPIDPADPAAALPESIPAGYRFINGFDPPTIGDAPVVTITVPASPPTITAGAAETFTATATDTEDGNIAANIVWTSTLDGALGTGGTINPVLTAGTHSIKATITDSDLNTRYDTIAATVVAAALTFQNPAQQKYLGGGESNEANWTQRV